MSTGSVFNVQSIISDKANAESLAIISNGNTHIAVTAGQYVYVKNHETLAEGMYKATVSIVANSTLSTSNVSAVSVGGLNDIIASDTNLYYDANTDSSVESNRTSAMIEVVNNYGLGIRQFKAATIRYSGGNVWALSLLGCG